MNAHGGHVLSSERNYWGVFQCETCVLGVLSTEAVTNRFEMLLLSFKKPVF